MTQSASGHRMKLIGCEWKCPYGLLGVALAGLLLLAVVTILKETGDGRDCARSVSTDVTKLLSH